VSKFYVSNSKESIRLFKNPVLDALSYVHWSYPLIFWVPIVGYCLYMAAKLAGGQPLRPVVYFTGGLVFWTLSEYLLHRFVFHYEPSSDLGKHLHFLLHGIHHDYPNDQKRLVMPPILAAILVIPFYLLFRWILGTGSAFFAASAGFLVGYLAYDMIHYAVHHAPLRHPIWKRLQKHHMVHHYHDPNHGFGVSSVIWDKAFGTLFPKNRG
jgi:sterol desaturase/sphingolipid hydroxylase (fatty acid hydroxylase superfamily)